MKKKIVLLLCSLFILSFWLFALTSCGNNGTKQDEEIEITTNSDYDYTLQNNKATLTKYKGAENKIVVPATIDSYPVIGLKGTFRDTLIESAEISEGIITIGDYTFNNCQNLKSVTIPDSSISIGENAFWNCKSLKELFISKSINVINEYAFYYCSALSAFTVDENNPTYCSIDGNIYSKDKKTFVRYAEGKTGSDFIIPDCVQIIENCAFYNCRNLASVTIPNSVTKIGDLAFKECYQLESINIPKSVVSIGRVVFYCCRVSTINVDENNPSYCSINGDLYTKDKKTLIKYASAKKDTSFTIPNTVTTIKEYAFHEALYLTSVSIPNSVTSIENDAFSYCRKLTSINIPDSITVISDWVFAGCDNLKSIEIPDSVTKIGDRSFVYCSNLEDVIIGNKVRFIEYFAFFDCPNLAIFYKGTEKNFKEIRIDNTSSGNAAINATTIYYYSASKPNASGNYWHYDANGEIAVWKN